MSLGFFNFKSLAWRVARRYLFARKSTNIINLITGIAVLGLAIGTAALILVLSVFNGFQDLLDGMYSNFNPDIKITPAQGKTFVIDAATLDRIRKTPGVANVAQTLEEVAFFEYEGQQDFGILKGVDQDFVKVTAIDSTVKEGAYQLHNGDLEMMVVGLGMRNKLGINVNDFAAPIITYLPKRKEAAGLDQQFRKGIAYPAGTFMIQQDFDGQYVLSSLEFVRYLLNQADALSSLEIRCTPGYDSKKVIAQLRKELGRSYTLKTRYQQQEAFMKLMELEKWMSFAIVSLMLMLVAFNLIGALWMIVLEKKKDISILKAMGAQNNTIRNIFLNEGALLSGLGIGVGIILALLIFIVQKTFGLVGMPGSFAVDSYPISLRFGDFIVVGLTVLGIGLLASLLPALRARQIPTISKEE
jgi:lipoprotein-releasing system permease protein